MAGKIVGFTSSCCMAAAVCFVPSIAFSDDNLVAFYDFKDGTTGESAGTIAVTAGDAAMTGTAAATKDGGVVPYYTNNVRVAIASDAVGSEYYLNPKALAFDYGADTGTATPPGGMVDFPALGAALTGKAEPFTIEYFVRMDENFSYYSPDNQWKYISKTSLYTGGDDDDGSNQPKDTGFKIVTPSNASSVTGAASLFTVEANSAGIKNASGSFSDGKWHHVAVVYSPGEDENGDKSVIGTLRFFVDYTSAGSFVYTNAAPTHTAAFRLGTGRKGKIHTEPFHGWITCLRVTAEELEKDGFMVMTDASAMADNVVFTWNFEEGTIGETIDKAAGYPLDTFDSADNNGVYCLFKNLLPQYAAGPGVGRGIMHGETKMPWKNGKCAYFRGYHSLEEGTSLRSYVGTEMNLPASSHPVRNPESWTMEAFVNVEYERGYALLFGKHAQKSVHVTPTVHPQICWMLTAETGGKLKISWNLADQDEYAQGTIKSTTTASDILVPGRWHHVALTYDKPARTFRLYVDYEKVKETVIEGELLEAESGYYFSRIELSNGFEGWMDEIRFSSVARTPESFVRLAPDGIKMIVR